MNAGNFDLEALVRALILGVGCGLIVACIGYFVTRERPDRDRIRPVLIMGACGLALISVVFFYYSFPTLVEVPKLDGNSEDEAKDVLAKRGLVPVSHPQPTTGVEAGRVIPHSQDPVQGLRVHRGTSVAFGVAPSSSSSSAFGAPAGVSVSFFDLKPGASVPFVRGGNGLYRCSVSGTSSGISNKLRLLLWVKPVNPPAEQFGVWYLQKSGNGSSVSSNGNWEGIAQLGNSEYPPRKGDTFDLAVTVTDATAADELLNGLNVVTRNQPIGAPSSTVSDLIVGMR